MRLLLFCAALSVAHCSTAQVPSGLPGSFPLGEGVNLVDDNDPFTPNRFIGSFRMETRIYRGTEEQRTSPTTLRYWSSADQVLTGAWFGVTSTVDPETIELLARHRARIRGGAKPGDPSVAELEAEIRRRLGTFDPDALDRLTAWKEDPPVETDVARREAVAADVREQLRARRKKG